MVELSIRRSLKHRGQNFIFYYKRKIISSLNTKDSLVGREALEDVDRTGGNLFVAIAGCAEAAGVEAALEHVEDLALGEYH